MSGFCSAHRYYGVPDCPTCAKTPREILIGELHDGLGECELCPTTTSEGSLPTEARCDLMHQLARAYDAGRAGIEEELKQANASADEAWAKRRLYFSERNELMTKALAKYGDHKQGCAVSKYLRGGTLDGEGVVCDCGWAEVLEKLKGKP